jgi:2-polyprenyl-3-methyl-5-hydroxy-6-metoxy-1,4-benzoquinol methylase
MRNRRKLIIDKLSKYSTRKNICLLDCGCGGGIITHDADKLGYNTIGLDISFEMIKNAKNHNDHSRFTVGKITKLPFKDNSFDGIICVGVIQYITNEIDVFREFNRILHAEGFLIFTLPNIATLKYLFDPYYYFVRLPSYIIRSFKKRSSNKNPSIGPDYDRNLDFKNKRYRINQLNHILEDHSFEIDDIIAVGYGPLTIFKKRIFSLAKSLQFSNSITEFVNKRNIKFLKTYANRWIYYAKKTKNKF